MDTENKNVKKALKDSMNLNAEMTVQLCKALRELGRNRIWRTTRDAKGKVVIGNCFILGIGQEPRHQIFFYLPIKLWDRCAFAETRVTAPDFDGHLFTDVPERLAALI